LVYFVKKVVGVFVRFSCAASLVAIIFWRTVRRDQPGNALEIKAKPSVTGNVPKWTFAADQRR
jgi:hypothetical protein